MQLKRWITALLHCSLIITSNYPVFTWNLLFVTAFRSLPTWPWEKMSRHFSQMWSIASKQVFPLTLYDNIFLLHLHSAYMILRAMSGLGREVRRDKNMNIYSLSILLKLISEKNSLHAPNTWNHCEIYGFRIINKNSPWDSLIRSFILYSKDSCHSPLGVLIIFLVFSNSMLPPHIIHGLIQVLYLCNEIPDPLSKTLWRELTPTEILKVIQWEDDL